jgi:transketolase
MLQYALIHLFGYNVTIDDLKNFRVRIQHNLSAFHS